MKNCLASDHRIGEQKLAKVQTKTEKCQPIFAQALVQSWEEASYVQQSLLTIAEACFIAAFLLHLVVES
jgi:hypothetical protein